MRTDKMRVYWRCT